MNRHDRRAQEALALRKREDVDQVVAVHEAGHAIAKVLSIGEFGYSINEAIICIEIGLDKVQAPSADGRMILCSQGVTYGHTFSREIETASSEFKQEYISERGGLIQGREQLEFLSNIIELGRSAGADISRWFRARVFDAVSGSIAEAIFTKRSFQEIWDGYQAESDLLTIMRDAHVSRIGTDEVTSTIDRMAVVSAYMMENPTVWSAVLALAKKLPAVGKMDGTDAVAIVTSVLSESEIDKMFSEGIIRLIELEDQINSTEVAVAISPDGSQSVFKGHEIIRKKLAAKEASIKATTFHHTFPVFTETLWRAFVGCGLPQVR